MACQAVQMWSLCGLVAAFVDLAIAYCLLCASAVAYLASKFLGFFGLNLPCPCDGMFINIYSKGLCLNRLLVDFPLQKVSDVQISAKHKFPFSDPKKYDYGDNCVNGILEIEGQGSCSSASDVVRRSGKYDVKGKGVVSHRPGSRLCHRRGAVGHGKNSSFSLEVVDGECCSNFSTKKKGNGLIGDSLVAIDNDETHHLEYDNKAPKRMRRRQKAVNSVEMNQSSDEDMDTKKTVEELQDNIQGVRSFYGDEKNTIRLLEQKLEEERTARAALYIDLEKERSAAASAADEAMAMILRLQEEKASIEMEARQYERMIEEKSAYDAEEMNILKEILVRREMEKHFLEKEVEEYKQMVSIGNEQLGGDGALVDPNDDPVSILRQLSATNDEKLATENECSDGVVSADEPNCKPAFEMESPTQFHDTQSSFEKHRDSNEKISVRYCGNMDLREKEIISADKNLQLTSRAPIGHKLAEKVIVTYTGTETVNQNYELSSKQQEEDGLLDKNLHVYDVHIVDHISEGNEDKNKLLVRDINSLPFGAVREWINVGADCPSTAHSEAGYGIKRSSSEVTLGLPPIGPRGLSSHSGQRRSSMSTVECEMLKIDSEVGRLREKLKLVQKGREKLGLSFENRERENVQLKLLEDIAWQVQEIRRLSVPRKTVRQVSLPLPNSKASSRKRRSRSVSSALTISSEG